MKKEIVSYRKDFKDNENYEYVEAEIVNDYDYIKKDKLSFFEKIRIKFGKALAFVFIPLSVGFLITGFLLSATVIGTIIGVPFIIIGIVILFFVFKVLRLLL